MSITEYLETAKNGIIEEYNVKRLLSSQGIRVPSGVLSDVLPDNLELKYPVVLKVSDPKILHKTDVGGLKVGIKNEDDLRREFDIMKARFPQSRFLVEEMEKQGLEIIIGVINDRNFGLTIMLGMGGIYTELYKDVTFRVVPIDRSDAADMVDSVSINRFADGFRGIKIDREALEELLIRVSDLADKIGNRLDQMDLNPVIARPDGTVVVDAKLSIKQNDPA